MCAVRRGSCLGVSTPNWQHGRVTISNSSRWVALSAGTRHTTGGLETVGSAHAPRLDPLSGSAPDDPLVFDALQRDTFRVDP